MGFALFTTSGTFNPSSYGLSAGDVVHVKAVGGGGGAGGYNSTYGYADGTDGAASSFGSILTAAGGLKGNNDSLPSSTQYSQQGVHCGGPGKNNITYMGLSSIWSGGAGGDGWAPGMQEYIAGMSAIFIVPFVVSNITTSGITAIATIPVSSLIYRGREFAYQSSFGYINTANMSPTTTPWSRAGGCSGGSAVTCGGVGYGAGGGGIGWNGNAVMCGANGGVITDIEHILDATSSIAVTVGAGGTGGYRGPSTYACGGGGACGCVAIWW